MSKKGTLSRREFLKTASVAGAGAIVAGSAARPAPTFAIRQSQETVRVLHHTYKPLNDLHERHLAEFMEANPDIDVRYSTVPDTEYNAVLFPALQAGTAADIVHGFGFALPAIAAAGYASPVPDEIAERVRTEFTPITYSGGLYQDTLYSVADQIGVRMAMWNLDLLEQNGVSEVPQTWYEVLEMNAKVDRKQGDIYTQAGTHLNWDPVVEWFPPLLWAHGASLWNEDVTEITLDEPGAVQAAWLWQNCCHPELGYYGDAFVAGLVGLVSTGSWFKGFVQEGNPDLRLLATKMPSGPIAAPMGAAHQSWFVNAASPPEVQEAAWRVLEYFWMRPETQLDWLEVGFLPNNLAALNDPLVQNDEWLQPFADALATAELAYPGGCVGWQTVGDILIEEVTRLSNWDITPEEFVRTMRERGNAALAEQGC
ncbi:MAG: substrate-binding domain-containing protein [Anaerolineae bacterium]|nr:substrate-binding domain-containing protein [Anaerolineae bacterium]